MLLRDTSYRGKAPEFGAATIRSGTKLGSLSSMGEVSKPEHETSTSTTCSLTVTLANEQQIISGTLILARKEIKQLRWLLGPAGRDWYDRFTETDATV